MKALRFALPFAVILLSAVPVLAQSISELKANMAASKAILRHYQWIETTKVSVHGDVKSTKQQLCFYGDDGSVVRQDLGDQQSSQGGNGGGLLLRRIKERKKEEMADYMKQAVELVKSYVPPSSSRIQAAKDAGNIAFAQEPGRILRLTIKNYQLPGDRYVLDINLSSMRPAHVSVSTYLGDPSQPVNMTATMGNLDSGATYAKDITLEAPSKNLTVTVNNSDYRSR